LPLTDTQTPIDQVKTRPPSAREKKRPAIQLGVVKLETPTPEPEPELPLAPSKSARRRKRHEKGDDGDESDDGRLTDQWCLARLMSSSGPMVISTTGT
jgi:hypothetical protein